MVKRNFVFMVLLSSLAFMFPLCSFSQTGTSAPIVYLPFDEGSGNTTVNGGTAGSTGEFVSAADFDTFVPEGDYAPPANNSSLYLGDGIGTPLGSGVTFPIDPLVGLTEFTITAWVYPTTEDQGAGGNRIVTTWQRGEDGSPNRRAGVELVWLNQQYRFSVNHAPDWPTDLYGGPWSGDGTSLSDWDWQFVAVTYDTRTDDLEFFPNAQMHAGYKGYDGVVQYYLGEAGLEVDSYGDEQIYDTGPVAPSVGVDPELMIGSFTTQIMETWSNHENRQFRGWIDEVRIYGEALTLEQIREVQRGVVTFVSNWSLY